VFTASSVLWLVFFRSWLRRRGEDDMKDEEREALEWFITVIAFL